MSETTSENTSPEDESTQSESVDKPLGENGEKALKAERERAKDLEKQLGLAATRLAEIERANESALETAQREAREAQEVATRASAEALRFRVAAKFSISDDDADLFLTGADMETLERQAARLVERTPATPTGPRPDLTQGGSGQPIALNSDGLEETLRSKLGIA